MNATSEMRINAETVRMAAGRFRLGDADIGVRADGLGLR
jgi:hypothetical protein